LNQAKEIFKALKNANLTFNNKGVVALFVLAIEQVKLLQVIFAKF
jgi:hypothetical protein